MKTVLPTVALAASLALIPTLAWAQATVTAGGFENVRRPVSNPTLFDLPIPQTYIKPLFMHQELPDRIATTAGDLDLEGDFQLYALQLQYALNERWAIVALKDGYVDLNPDATLSEEEGFANISAGLKYAFLLQPENGRAAAVRLMFEIPIGDEDVAQGEGSGVLIPSIDVLQLYDRWQFAGTLGGKLPLDNDDESTVGFASGHVSYALLPNLFPLLELNYFRVLDEGDGGARFKTHAGGAVPGILSFEGGDLLNFGALNGDDNADFLSLALGARWDVTETVALGAAYEFPLTDEEESLMESRLTLDLTWQF